MPRWLFLFALSLPLSVQAAPAPDDEVGRFLAERGVLTRYTGDTLALSPPLIVEKKEIDQIFTTIGDVLKTVE